MLPARSNFLFLAPALRGEEGVGWLIFAIRSNKIMINLRLGTVGWKLFITKSPANPIRSFAEFLFGRIKFCKSWGQILQISAAHSPTQLGANQSNPTARRGSRGCFCNICRSNFLSATPIALSILAVRWQNGFCLKVDEFGRYFGKSGDN